MGQQLSQSVRAKTRNIVSVENFYKGEWFQVGSDKVVTHVPAGPTHVEVVVVGAGTVLPDKVVLVRPHPKTRYPGSHRMYCNGQDSGTYNIVHYEEPFAVVTGNTWENMWVLSRRQPPREEELLRLMDFVPTHPKNKFLSGFHIQEPEMITTLFSGRPAHM